MLTNNKHQQKNVLFISHIDAYPYKFGGQIGIFFPLIYFANKCNVFFAFLTKDNTDYAKEKYKEFNIKPIPLVLNTEDNYFKYPLSMFSKLSFKFSKFYRKNFMEQLCNVIKNNDIDTVWCFAAQTSNYGVELKKRFPHLKIYLREHNIEYKLVKQYSIGTTNLVMKLIAYYEYLKTKIYEINVWKKFDKVFFISDTDLATAKKYNKNFDDSNLIYDGMQLCENNENIEVEKNSFIFTGSFTTFQNENNLKYFIKNIWIPFIQKVPDAKFYLTGNDDKILSQKLKIQKQELEKYNIINLGFVNNIKKTILSKQYVISPTLYGSGIRLKVLEALSLGKMVFVTDIDYTMSHLFEDKVNIIHYKDANDFYNKYIQINNDIDLQEKIMCNAKQLIREYFSWNRYIERADILK